MPAFHEWRNTPTQMAGDERTQRYYADAAEAYAAVGPGKSLVTMRNQFMSMLPLGAAVIDLGCGGGHDSLAFKRSGLRVTALDASPELARIASRRLGQQVLVSSFEDLEFQAEFAGAWASASLLHLTPRALPSVLARIAQSLVPNGAFAASFKSGATEWRDRHGRYFCPMSEESLVPLLEAAGFVDITLSTHAGFGSDGEPTKWIWAFARAQSP